MPSDKIQDKDGVTIQEGDQVWTKMRGGKHEGQVEKIVTTKEDADAENVKNPPKVSGPTSSQARILARFMQPLLSSVRNSIVILG
jgi:hypothetical protein